MKGGEPGAVVYYYDAGNGGLDDSDAGITTPINTNGKAAPTASATSTSASIPKGDHGRRSGSSSRRPPRRRGRRSTPGTSRSPSTSRTSNLKTGRDGHGQWKVDVTQTGSVARNALCQRDDHGRRTRTTSTSPGVTRRAIALPGAVVDCDGTSGPDRFDRADGAGQRQHQCTYCGAARLPDRRHERGDRDGRRSMASTSRTPGRPTSRSATRRSRSTRRSRPSTARTRGTASTGRRRSRTPSSSAARARAGRTS